MAAVIALNDVIEATWDFVFNGQHILLTHHYKVDSLSGAAPTLTASLTAFGDVLNALGNLTQKLCGCYVDTATNGQLYLQKIWPFRYLRQAPATTFTTGTNVAYETILPPNVAMAITLRGENSGPHFKGTKHIGCLGSNFVEDGMITADGLTALSDLGEGLIFAQTFTATGTTVHVSPLLLNRSSPSTSTTVTNYIRGRTSRVQRRRTVGLGI